MYKVKERGVVQVVTIEYFHRYNKYTDFTHITTVEPSSGLSLFSVAPSAKKKCCKGANLYQESNILLVLSDF